MIFLFFKLATALNRLENNFFNSEIIYKLSKLCENEVFSNDCNDIKFFNSTMINVYCQKNQLS